MKTRKRYNSKRYTRKKIGGQPVKKRTHRGINTEKAAKARRNRSNKLRKERKNTALRLKRMKSFKDMKSLKEKLKEKTNNNSLSILNSYKRVIKFISLFIEVGDYLAKTKDIKKQAKYDEFAMLLKYNLKEINDNDEFSDITEELNENSENNENNENKFENPLDYLEEYVEFVEDENLEKKFEESFGTNEHQIYYDFMKDTVDAVQKIIIKFSKTKVIVASAPAAMALENINGSESELESGLIVENDVNINSLIAGLSAVKMNKNNSNINSVLNRLFGLSI